MKKTREPSNKRYQIPEKFNFTNDWRDNAVKPAQMSEGSQSAQLFEYVELSFIDTATPHGHNVRTTEDLKRASGFYNFMNLDPTSMVTKKSHKRRAFQQIKKGHRWPLQTEYSSDSKSIHRRDMSTQIGLEVGAGIYITKPVK